MGKMGTGLSSKRRKAIFRLSGDLYGAPALTLRELAEYDQDLIIGTNRWSFKGEVGVSKALGVDSGVRRGGNAIH